MSKQQGDRAGPSCAASWRTFSAVLLFATSRRSSRQHVPADAEERFQRPLPELSGVLHDVGLRQHAGLERVLGAVGVDALILQPDGDAIHRVPRLGECLHGGSHMGGQFLHGVRALADFGHLAFAHAKLLIRIRGVADQHRLPLLHKTRLPGGGEELRLQRGELTGPGQRL